MDGHRTVAFHQPHAAGRGGEHLHQSSMPDDRADPQAWPVSSTLALPMTDYFQETPDLTPYGEANIIAGRNDPDRRDADSSSTTRSVHEDAAR